jgi:hypothetical protein
MFDGDTKNGREPCYAGPHAVTAAVTPDKGVTDVDHPDSRSITACTPAAWHVEWTMQRCGVRSP